MSVLEANIKIKQEDPKLSKRLVESLTVKPIRIQLDEPKHTLQETLNFSIKSADVQPLEMQIAGHGSDGDDHRGLLVHPSGLVLKPVQAAPKGPREVAFYTRLSASSHNTDLKLRSLTAKFYGCETLGDCDYLVLENLTDGLVKPCVMDVKIGRRTYGPDASLKKREKEDAKYCGTKVPLGFSVLGIITHSEGAYTRLTKEFGRSLTVDNVDQVLTNFIDLDAERAKLICQVFVEKLQDLIKFFSSQSTYHFYASSLLFLYDNDAADVKSSVRLKMIDFAHVFPGQGTIDTNFIHGLQNVTQLFSDFMNTD